MAATEQQINRLRRMANEPTGGPYAREDLAAILEQYPVSDAAGLEPGDAGWIPTYDLNLAAAEVWREKAAAVVHEIDFAVDGGEFNAGQLQRRYLDTAESFQARGRARSVALSGG